MAEASRALPPAAEAHFAGDRAPSTAEAAARIAAARERADLDAQFTLDRIENLASVQARRAEAGRAALERFAVVRDISYGPDPGERLHLFPTHVAAAPVQLFIHGGFWMSMEAIQFSFLARGFVPFGAAAIVIDYPLIPSVRMADIVRSCRRAVAWVHRHGAEHGLDPERIFISGNSAGGHLVAELMDRRWTGEFDLPRDIVKGGAAISGLYDLAPVAASFKQDDLGFTEDEVAQFSPLHRAVDIGAPLIVAVGGEETEEFLQQSAAFAEKCRAAGAPVEHLVPRGADHITIVLDHLANPASSLNAAARRQMGLRANGT